MTDQLNRPVRTPVYLLTGCLGSGKTTLLQRLLGDPSMAGTAVLMNEFGEIPLDHHLLERIDETVVLLSSGCLCCTVRGELAESLIRLNSQRSKGEIPPFDRVVIETTGLADPFPAMSTLRAHPVLVNHFALAGVITTVDVVNIDAQIDRDPAALRQIAAADALVLTKADIVEEPVVRACAERLSALNPAARLSNATELPDPKNLLAGPGQRMLDLPVSTASQNYYGPLHHHHGEGTSVRSFSLVPKEQVNWTGFGLWLTMLLNRHGDRVLRVKGVLAIEGEERPVAIHGVGRLVHPPVHMSAWPSDERSSRIVFIVDGLDPERILDSFARFNRVAHRLAPA